MMIKTTMFTHRPRVSLAQFSFCWWRHNRLPMTSQLNDAVTWIMISNSLNIDFIHGDIHGRSCKNYPFPNFNSCTVEVWEWISNFVPYFSELVGITVLGLRLNHIRKRGPCRKGFTRSNHPYLTLLFHCRVNYISLPQCQRSNFK